MSQFEIDINCDVPANALTIRIIRRAAEATLEYQGLEPPQILTIVLSDDTRLKELNYQFLGEDKPTDVLSFPSGEDMPGMDEYLGDIAVSIPAAKRQAKAAGHTLDAELQLLTIHGVLHLLGYDHDIPEKKEVMWSAQEAICRNLGVSISLPG